MKRRISRYEEACARERIDTDQPMSRTAALVTASLLSWKMEAYETSHRSSTIHTLAKPSIVNKPMTR